MSDEAHDNEAEQAPPVLRIGAMTFRETEATPRFYLSGQAPSTGESEGLPQPVAVVTFLPDTVTLDTARARLPFLLRLPTWTPTGFTLYDEVQVVDGQSPVEGTPLAFPTPLMVHLRWQSANVSINYSVRRLPPGRRGPVSVPLGSVTTTQVNHTPAALQQGVRGFSPQLGEAVTIDALVLRWEEGDLMYELQAHGGGVTAEDLLRMAESLERPGQEQPPRVE